MRIKIETYSEITYVIDRYDQIFTLPKVISTLEGETIEFPFLGQGDDFKSSRINLVWYLDSNNHTLETCFSNLEYI